MIKADIYNEQLLRKKIVELSKLQLNKIYKHGEFGPDYFDCTGLVWYIYQKALGIDIFENGFGVSTTTMIMTSDMGNNNLYEEKDPYKDLSIINEGDILLFHRQSKNETEPKPDNKYPGHCGIYIGNNEFIHCPLKPGIVLIDNLEDTSYWKAKLVASKDIIKKRIK